MIIPRAVYANVEDDIKRCFEAFPKPAEDGSAPSRADVDAALNQVVAILTRLRKAAHQYQNVELLRRVQILSLEADQFFGAAINATRASGLVVPG